ncbi:MAG: type IV pilus modification PilV family protein, partial [Methylobacter sp.]
MARLVSNQAIQVVFMAMYRNKIKKQRGIGLIEVLITSVMIAIGLMALTSLQGSLMNSSGDTKARSEAVKLAETKLEQFRNNISKTGFDTDLATGNDSVDGTNATFTRSWTVTDAASPARKNIGVQVTWGGASADETVNMVSQAVWANPGKATDYATDGNGLSAKAPSPNNNSSATPGKQFDLDEITGETALTDGSGLIQYKEDGGHIYLLDSSGKALIQFNGGIIHTIKGHVWEGIVGNGNNPTISLAPLTDFPVTFSDLAYCVFPVTEGESDYICYFGGDCTDQGSGCDNSDESV